MNEKEIRQLIKIVEDTGIAELEVKKWWGERIRIVKNGTISQTVVHDSKGNSVVEVPAASPAPPAETAEPVKDYTVVTSLMVGTFYRAPAPGEAPFVSVGDTVKIGQTLCIIEAMKIMNEIESEVSGIIVKILVENTQPVEYNQPLFYIKESK